MRKSIFQKYGIEENIQEFEVSSATVELAAAAVNCAPQRIAKTLSFMVDGHAMLIVTAGDAKIDNHKAAAPTVRLNLQFRNWRNIPVMRNGWMSVKDMKNDTNSVWK